MIRVTLRQQQVLEALADYHLVPAQMVRLGLSRSGGARCAGRSGASNASSRRRTAKCSETPNPPSADTGDRDTRLAVLQVEKAHLEEDRERMREEVERLRRELVDERGKRENERSAFMALLRQKEETVQLLTDQTNPAKRRWWQKSKAAM